MTYKEFLSELVHLKVFGPHLNENGYIRFNFPEISVYPCCPIIAVAQYKGLGWRSNCQALIVGEDDLGLSVESVHRIIGGADGLMGPVRTDMLEALGLREVA